MEMRKTTNRGYKLLVLLALASLLSGQGLVMAQETIPTPPIPESSTVAAATDTAYPSDVENVKAMAGDKMVTLSWDAATDNVAVTGYKIFYGTSSVASDTASYTMGPVDAGNVLTYDVKDLQNDTTYYFAVTAYDAAGNESEFYSEEVSATPKTGATGAPAADDKTAPKVVSATAPFKNMVKVTFSEGVKLPTTAPESAFSIKDDFLGTALAISKAEMDTTDKSNKTVVLTTAEQKKNSKYILTAGIQIQDLAGNPIVSGTSDTAVFSGTDAEQVVKPAAPETPADTAAPAFTSVKAVNSNTVEVVFSEPVVLLANASENFIITDAADNTKITNVTKVAISQEGAKATLSTENLEAKKYNLIAIKVKDVAGNMMDVQNSATTFDGVAPSVINPPVNPTPSLVEEAASDLIAKAVSSMMVNLSWQTKPEQLANAANFVVYMSTDRGATYGNGIVLGKDAKSYDFSNLTEDMVYYFKLTTRNSAGQESEGLITYLTLPKTGPELALLLLTSAGGGWAFTRKKKK